MYNVYIDIRIINENKNSKMKFPIQLFLSRRLENRVLTSIFVSLICNNTIIIIIIITNSVIDISTRLLKFNDGQVSTFQCNVQ